VFVLLAVIGRPDLIRSWASDSTRVLHPGYAWHELAQMWQTPQAGEAWVQRTLDAPRSELASLLVSRGMAAPVAGGWPPASTAPWDAASSRCTMPRARHFAKE
jgi:hypothetical protein